MKKGTFARMIIAYLFLNLILVVWGNRKKQTIWSDKIFNIKNSDVSIYISIKDTEVSIDLMRDGLISSHTFDSNPTKYSCSISDKDENGSYYISDFNGDGIPELKSYYHNPSQNMFFFIDGKFKKAEHRVTEGFYVDGRHIEYKDDHYEYSDHDQGPIE
jgi:hypothetical protein